MSSDVAFFYKFDFVNVLSIIKYNNFFTIRMGQPGMKSIPNNKTNADFTDGKKTREKLKYSVIRACNQLLNIYCYEYWNHPYSPHLIFDKEGNIQIISWDQTFSVIDLKSANSKNTIISSTSKIQNILNEDLKFFQEEFGLEQWKDSVNDVVEYMKSIAIKHLKDNKFDYESLWRTATNRYPVTQRLYQLIGDPKDYFTIDNQNKRVKETMNNRLYLSYLKYQSIFLKKS